MAAGDVCDVCPTQISEAVRTGDVVWGRGLTGPHGALGAHHGDGGGQTGAVSGQLGVLRGEPGRRPRIFPENPEGCPHVPGEPLEESLRGALNTQEGADRSSRKPAFRGGESAAGTSVWAPTTLPPHPKPSRAGGLPSQGLPQQGPQARLQEGPECRGRIPKRALRPPSADPVEPRQTIRVLPQGHGHRRQTLGTQSAGEGGLRTRCRATPALQLPPLQAGGGEQAGRALWRRWPLSRTLTIRSH